MTDVLIIGSGPAGYTAAIYTARAGYKVQLVTGTQMGGQLTIASLVENYPGFAEPVAGPELMENMRRQAEKMGVEIIFDTIESADFQKRPFVCCGEKTYESRAVVIATGANARWLGLSSEKKYRGRGVSACATCDGFFFKNKTVCVVGGGNTALGEAVYLTNFARKVYLIHRRETFSAEKIIQQRVFQNPKIEILYNKRIEEILGDEKKVTGVRLIDTENSQSADLELDGVFIAVGHTPASSVFKEQISLDEDGYILTGKNDCETSVPGVFAAGDVCDRKYRQAVVAAGQGCIAAANVEKYLESLQN